MKERHNLSRVLLFVALCLTCVLGLGSYYWRVASMRSASAAPPAVVSVSAPHSDEAHLAQPVATLPHPALSEGPPRLTQPPTSDTPTPEKRRVFFRWTATDQHYGKLAVVNYPRLEAPHFVDSHSCEVLHFAGGRGICLKADRGVFTRYTAEGFDASFRRTFHIPLNGIPSRTRLSPDGRLAAVTVFLTGHSYASVDFTTQTLLLDASTGNTLADLEHFTIVRDGEPFHSKDFNFWGVTFTPDGRRFFCTLSSNRKHYLVEGEVISRTARVIHENVECPSLSPDATRIAYKKRLPGDRAIWQLHILDLATRHEIPLAEQRSIDDQLEWFDDTSVLYALPDNMASASATTEVWIAAVNGSQPPTLFLRNAYSPTVVR